MAIMTPGVILLLQEEEAEILSIVDSQYNRFEQEHEMELRDVFANALFTRMVIWKHDSRCNELLSAELESGDLCMPPNPEKVDCLGRVNDDDWKIAIHPSSSEKYTDIVDFIIKTGQERYGQEYVQIEFGN